MTAPRLTIRVRLTLLYTGVFAVCGAIVCAITYAFVAGLPKVDASTLAGNVPADFVDQCQRTLLKPTAADDPSFQHKCEAAYREGVLAGAQSQRDTTLTHMLQYSLLTLAIVTILAAIAGWIVASRVLRPLHQITNAARTASEHNLSARISLTGPRDELRELADTFDDMLGRLQATFESQRRFIANASHELRTPLTVMRASVDVVLAKPAPTQGELVGMGQDVRIAVDQAEALVGALLTLARAEHGPALWEEVDLATVAEDVLDSTDSGDLQVLASLEPAVISGDPVLLARIVANLVDNAVRYNTPGGDVWLTTSTTDSQAVLTVANTGPVIAPTVVDSLFEPFRRLHERSTRDGFGLGLALAASIATAHNGAITAQPLPEGGLKVTVAFPGGGPTWPTLHTRATTQPTTVP